MKFDIFKRSTKEDRIAIIEKGMERRILSKHAKELYDRLSEVKYKKIGTIENENEKYNYSKNSKKINTSESNELYNRLMKWNKNIAMKLNYQRMIKKKKLEIEKKELMQHNKNKGNKVQNVREHLYKNTTKRQKQGYSV